MDVSGWLTQQVTIVPLASYDATGGPVYGGQVTVGARIIPKAELVVAARTGQEAVSSHQIYVENPIYIEDRVFLPGDNTSDPTVAKVPIRVDQAYDKSGNPVYWKITV